MASSPKRPDSPHIRRKSWPSQPRSILKKRPESPKIQSVEETESGLGHSITTNSHSSDSNERPNNISDPPVATKKDVIEVVQEENNSVNSAATVISARTARKRRIAGIFQHYYPEGGWGYVVLLSAFLSQILAQGLQLGMLVLMPYASRRFHASSAEIGKTKI